MTCGGGSRPYEMGPYILGPEDCWQGARSLPTDAEHAAGNSGLAAQAHGDHEVDDAETWQKTVVVDVDGVLAEYEGWTGEFQPPGPPIVGTCGMTASMFTQRLRDCGWRVVIHSCRCPRPAGYDDRADQTELREWLAEHDIQYDELHTGPGKPPADVYLDDRGVRFTGSFLDALDEIVHARPHWDAGKGK